MTTGNGNVNISPMSPPLLYCFYLTSPVCDVSPDARDENIVHVHEPKGGYGQVRRQSHADSGGHWVQ